MIDLSGKATLVTGGSRGVGGAISLNLAECGANVPINCKSREAESLREASPGAKGAAGAYPLRQAANCCPPYSPPEFRVGYTIDTPLAQGRKRGSWT